MRIPHFFDVSILVFRMSCFSRRNVHQVYSPNAYRFYVFLLFLCPAHNGRGEKGGTIQTHVLPLFFSFCFIFQTTFFIQAGHHEQSRAVQQLACLLTVFRLMRLLFFECAWNIVQRQGCWVSPCCCRHMVAWKLLYKYILEKREKGGTSIQIKT